MKTKGLLVLLLTLLISTVAVQAQNKNSHKKTVSVRVSNTKKQKTPLISSAISSQLNFTYVTKSMLDFAAGTKIGGMKIEDLKNKLESVEIYSNLEGNSRRNLDALGLVAIATRSAEKKGFDMVLNLTYPEKNESVTFYTITEDEDENTIKDLVMIRNEMSETKSVNIEGNSSDGGKCTVIRLVGKFTSSDFKKIIGK